jgi:hypothetical protein
VDDREQGLGTTPEGLPPRRGPGRLPRDVRDVASDERVAAERERNDREHTEDRDMTEDERLELFRESLHQSVLPDLPPMPGYHTFWATTTNPRDSIAWRLRIGYSLIRAEDCPAWDGISIKSGDYAGAISVNEMLGMRIPLALYNSFFREVHHNMPLAEEEKIRSSVERVSADARQRGSKVTEGDGMAELAKRVRPPPEFTS